jgi:hypothetical protein
MKQKIMIAAAFAAVFAVPASTFAATYAYINTSGQLETIVAADATQALALPTDRAPHSGVLLLHVVALPVTTTTTIGPTATTTSTTTMVM